jgi:hypothetical protein
MVGPIEEGKLQGCISSIKMVTKVETTHANVFENASSQGPNVV